MIYVAQRPLETADTLYSPGDAILEFPQWDATVQRAHLNQGNVERVHGELGDRPTGRSKADLRKEREEEEARLKQLEAAADGVDSPDDPGDDEDDGEDLIPPNARLDDDMFTCPACEGSVFASPEGLMKHAEQEHDGRVPTKATRKRKQNDKRFAKLAPEPPPDAERVPGDLTAAGIKVSKRDEDDE